MTRLCVALVEKGTDTMLEAMRGLPREVDMVELRLDAMASCELERLLSGRDRPVIVSNRPERGGGFSDRPERERLGALRRAAELGAEYVDVELDAVDELGALPGATAKIVSYHNFAETPYNLDTIFRRIKAVEPAVVKITAKARDMADVARVLDLLRRRAGDTPLIALSMGEEGLPTRVLAAKFGAFLTFASRESGLESAPGQAPYSEMLGMYRFHQVDAATTLYGVIGNPVAHSMSPAAHNAALAALDINAVYLPFKVTDPALFLDQFEPLGLRGASVTIPYKEAALGLMDEADELARRVGAVNTVKLSEGRRYGCNTDVSAAVRSVEAAAARAGLGPLGALDVLLVGAGGAARAIAYGLHGRVGRLSIANRTAERGQRLAKELDADPYGLDEVADLAPDVLINATSVGMWPGVNECPVPDGALRAGMVVFDSVYNPIRTELLKRAEAAGATVASGVDWFVNQAAAQFELWTGQGAPREVMRRELEHRLGKKDEDAVAGEG